jgi:hypothetical protein
MKKPLGLLLMFAVAATHGARQAQAVAFTTGNLAIYRVGAGTDPLINTGSAVFVDEYSPAGTLVQSIALPTTAAVGPNFIASGTATSEGLLNRSPDGTKLVLAGYNSTIPAAATLNATTGAAVNRVVATLGGSGVPSLYGFSDFADGNNPRSVAIDGNNLYMGGGAGGVRYQDLSTLTPGTTGNTSTQLSTTVTNIRGVDIFGGQLYVTTMSGAFRGVSTVGTGVPTTNGQTIALLTGFDPSATSPESAYGFFLANPNTLYVADDRVNGSGGIQKWVLDSGTWGLKYTLATSATIGARGLTGLVGGTDITLFATTTDSKFVSILDPLAATTAPGNVFANLATAATNTAFRGIDFVPTGGASPIDANFDSIGVVDGSDFLIWQKGLGVAPPANKSTGDSDLNGAVNGADLSNWRGHFGLAAGGAAAGAIPEPASLGLGLVAMLGLAGLRRGAKKS